MTPHRIEVTPTNYQLQLQLIVLEILQLTVESIVIEYMFGENLIVSLR